VTGSLVYVLLDSEGAVVTRACDALGSSAALGCAAFTSVCVFLLEYGTSKLPWNMLGRAMCVMHWHAMCPLGVVLSGIRK
jgi:hypothetical protein